MPKLTGITALPDDVSNSYQSNNTLPTLRQDLRLFRGPLTADGSPSWTLYDPVRDSYYRIGWTEFEMLARWETGNITALLESVNRDTTLNITQHTVYQLIQFLISHSLIIGSSHNMQPSIKHSITTRIGMKLQKYLFLKFPLIHPDPLLERILPIVRFMYDRLFFKVLAISTIIALFLVIRQWDSFVNTFINISSPLAAPWLLAGLVLSKICHEFGHALTAKYYGLKVPSMGVAFLVAWPVLYTDTNAAWKLRSRHARLAIDGAGILAEIILAVFATILWLFLPDGPQRDAACFIATVTWVITLMINGNPLMRFDGYYLLSDLINFPNLQQRSFELARWYTRKIILGNDEPVPAIYSIRKQIFLIIYAWACWVYRIFLFVGIAAFLYYFTFKLLGIALAVSVITWFILRPAWLEFGTWINQRHHLSWNRQTKRTTFIWFSILLFLFIPWSTHINVPALIQYESHAQIYPPYPTRIKAVLVRPDESLSVGQTLFELDSPVLTHRIASNTRHITILQQQLNQQLAQKKILQRSTVLQEELATAIAERDGLQRQKAQLTIKASIAGVVADLADGLSSGLYVNTDTRLALIINRDLQTIYAYVPEREIDRISLGNTARFIADNPEMQPISATVKSIMPMTAIAPKEQLLASEYGGPIDVIQDHAGHMQPSSAIYKITIDLQDNTGSLDTLTLGSVRISCEGESIVHSIYQSIVGLIVREGGF